MKKLLLFFTATLTFTVAFAAYVAPVRTMIIPLAHQPFVIDGIDDDAQYSAEQSTYAFNPTGSTGADADYTFTFKVAYDTYYLYVFGKILDDYDNSWEWGDTNQWEYDNVELFMDLDTNGSGSAPLYDSNTYQVRFNRGIDSVGNDFGRSGQVNRWDHKYYWENTADGWAFESALAWKFVLGPGQKTEDILQYMDGIVVSGFDMSGADSDLDGAGHRDCQTAWDNDEPQDAADRTEDNAWNNRGVFGAISFEYYCCDPCEWDPADCFPNSTNEIEYQELVIYPNPTSNLLTFDNSFNYIKLEIINAMGLSVMLDKELISGKNEIDISGLPNGNMYFLRIKDLEGNISTAKFIKK